MLSKFLIFAGISALIYLGIALILIVSQQTQKLSGEAGLDFSSQLADPAQTPLERTGYTARDGVKLRVLHLSSGRRDAPLLILVHGSGWHGQQFDGLASRLTKQADILVPDLRGHGAGPQRRGDLDYIGQLEDDLADLIHAYRRDGQKVVLAGHSSGGGLVVRFAGGTHGEMIDGAILMAPFLKYNAPSTRQNAGGWAHPLTRRIIGLGMLNRIHITALNHLVVMQFAMPKAVLDGPLGHTATVAYSYRLNQSYAPRSAYLQDIAALPKFSLIVGSKDEAFYADRYRKVMGEVTDQGAYHLIDGASHLEIVDAPNTLPLITAFLDRI